MLLHPISIMLPRALMQFEHLLSAQHQFEISLQLFILKSNMIEPFLQTTLLSINEFRMALPLVLPVINKLIYSALIVTESAGQPSVRLFSGLVLFFVITVQVAAVKSRSTKWPHPVLQLESEREPSDDGEAHFAFTKRMIT